MSYEDADARRASTDSMDDNDEVLELNQAVLNYQQQYLGDTNLPQVARRESVPGMPSPLSMLRPVDSPAQPIAVPNGTPKQSKTPGFLLKKPPMIDVAPVMEVDSEPNALQRTPSKASPVSPFTPSFREGDPSSLEYTYNTHSISPTYDALPRSQVPEYLKNPFMESEGGPVGAVLPARVPSPGSPQFALERTIPAWRNDEVEDSEEEEEMRMRKTNKYNNGSYKDDGTKKKKAGGKRRRSESEKKKKKEVSAIAGTAPVQAIDEKSPKAKKTKKRPSTGTGPEPGQSIVDEVRLVEDLCRFPTKMHVSSSKRSQTDLLLRHNRHP